MSVVIELLLGGIEAARIQHNKREPFVVLREDYTGINWMVILWVIPPFRYEPWMVNLRCIPIYYRDFRHTYLPTVTFPT